MTGPSLRKAFLILLVLAISATFVAMIRDFLMTILLAAILAGLAYPLFARLVRLVWEMFGTAFRRELPAVSGDER
jgi:predicted PurR-regulated permease PerM